MNRIRKFPGKVPSDRWMVFNAYFTLVGINLLLKFIPYNQLRQFVANQAQKNEHYTGDPVMVNRIVNAVKIACRNTPGKSTCLVKALAGYYLLTKNHIHVEMFIGVKLGLPGQLDAHAWVMNQGEVILGYLDDLPTYTKLNSQSMKTV